MVRVALVMALASIAGCFSPKYTSGNLRCGPEGQCPPGFECIDSRCYRPGEGPGTSDGGLHDLAGADLTSPDLLIPDLLPVVYPPAAVWISSGGGSGVAVGSAGVGLSCGGTAAAGVSTATSGAKINFGYFANASFE
jgi:hypothetical protein